MEYGAQATIASGEQLQFPDFTLTYVGMQESTALIDDSIPVKMITAKFLANGKEFHFYKTKGEFESIMTFHAAERSFTMQRIQFTPEAATFIVTKS